MRNFVLGASALIATLLVAGCAPDPGGVEDRTTPAAAETAEAEATGPAVVVAERQAVPGQQVALLGKVVDIPFEHRQVYDRVRSGPNDVPERQVGLLAPGTDHQALAIELQRALDNAGLRTQATGGKDGAWVWITMYGDAGQGKVAVRPDANRPETVIVFKIPEA